MSVVRKPLAEIKVADLEELIATGARESGELEFKGDLPARSEKGSSKVDRWIEKADRVGDFARDEILAEMVAFANAEGGTLILGLHETKTEPRQAERLEPLPNCEELARRLASAAEDVVEPRMGVVAARGLCIDDEAGAGYVLLRVVKSLNGPHRLTSTREFYVRRGERTARMTVREIRDLTLRLARSGDHLLEQLGERSRLTHNVLAALPRPSDRESEPLIIRVTALPTTPQTIDDLTSRSDLWWTRPNRAMAVLIGEVSYDCGYPPREFDARPDIRLRAFSSRSDRDHRGVDRLLAADGTIEFSLVRPKWEFQPGRAADNRLYIGWVIGLVVGALCQIDHLRKKLAWDAVQFAFEVELVCRAPLTLKWNDRSFSDSNELPQNYPLLLPRYEVGLAQDFDALVTLIVRDLMNAAGRRWQETCSVPWTDEL